MKEYKVIDFVQKLRRKYCWIDIIIAILMVALYTFIFYLITLIV